ncbi:MAG: hypothetical protein WC314_16700 [Vulcanimicrobiota bacterium]
MINRQELEDRFGDIEFLNELWQKTRIELPHRVEELRPYMLLESVSCQEELGKRLHKLRGLISNFLTEGRATALIVQCENLVAAGHTDDLPNLWPRFESLLQEEVGRLDRWLVEQGL